MANFYIAFDEDDGSHGLYFKRSKDDIVTYINANCVSPVINELPSNTLNREHIDELLPRINNSNYLFIAYSHGLSDQLTQNNVHYIRVNINAHLFQNSMFYSMSCSTGKELGYDMVYNHGSHGFIGYNDESVALINKYSQVYINCDNYGIKKFIDGRTLSESFQLMKEYFLQQIDLLESEGEPLVAGLLRRNLSRLVCYGDENLTINVF